MIDSMRIYQKAMALSKKYHTKDPQGIAEAMGIFVSDTLDSRNLLGMYFYKWRSRCIFLHPGLEPHVRKCIIAHELGHDQFHRRESKSGAMREYTLFRMNDQMEYEANAFASHLILDTDETMEQIREGATAVEIAQKACVDINMVLIKVEELRKLGYDLRVPGETNGSFLRKLSPDFGKDPESSNV